MHLSSRWLCVFHRSLPVFVDVIFSSVFVVGNFVFAIKHRVVVTYNVAMCLVKMKEKWKIAYRISGLAHENTDTVQCL